MNVEQYRVIKYGLCSNWEQFRMDGGLKKFRMLYAINQRNMFLKTLRSYNYFYDGMYNAFKTPCIL